MQNPGERSIADDGSLQQPRKFRVNYGAGGACVQEKTEGAEAIHLRLNDNQISVAQSEPDDLACLLRLRGKRPRKNNQEHEKKKGCN